MEMDLAQSHEFQNSSIVSGVARPPNVGFLTRTLIRSPVVQWILPGRIRHKDRNDVVFVHNTSIEIKEYAEGNFRDVTWKTDFDSTILSAGIIGSTNKVVVAPALSGIDAIIKQEMPDHPDGSAVEMEIDAINKVPPQLLVLTLRSGSLCTIAFLFAFHDLLNRIRWLSYQWPMPSRHPRHLGPDRRQIAVEPRSCFLAVSKPAGFTVYALKNMNKIRDEVEHDGAIDSDRFKPVKEERHIDLPGSLGSVLKLEFLHPPRELPTMVYLQLVVSVNTKTSLIRYEWDRAGNLHDLKISASEPVHPGEECPLLLIPFSVSTGFMLVCERVIATYSNVLAETPSKHNAVGQEYHDPAEEPGSSKKWPIWTSWTRAIRHDSYASEKENIYLCREDGFIRFLEFRKDILHMGMFAKVSNGLNINVDTAFAILDTDTSDFNDHNESYDLLVVGGDMSDGGIFLFRALDWGKPKLRIPSWTPVLDFVTADVPPFSSRGKKLSRVFLGDARAVSKERVFACVGRGTKHGAICELHYGLEARSEFTCEVSFVTTGIWIFTDERGVAWILFTSPGSTSIVPLLDDDVEELPNPFGLVGLDEESLTLAAGRTVDDLYIQITEESIRIVSHKVDHQFVQKIEERRIMFACIEGYSSATLVVIGKGLEVYLQYAEFSVSNGRVSFKEKDGEDTTSLIQLHSEVTSATLQCLNQQSFAFVGTRAQTLKMFLVGPGSNFVLVQEYSFNGDNAICNSVAVVVKKHDAIPEGEIMVLCGLRNGSLHILCFTDKTRSGQYDLQTKHTLTIGSTSVSIFPEAASFSRTERLCSSAILFCGKEFCRLGYQDKEFGMRDPTILSIWSTLPTEPGFRQTSVTAVGQIGPWDVDPFSPNLSHTLAKVLFFAEGLRIHGARLDPSSKTRPVVRRIRIGGAPNRILYSRYLNKLIVGLTNTIVRDAPRQNGKIRTMKKRLQYPVIAIIDPDDVTSPELEGERPEEDDQPFDGDINSLQDPERCVVGHPSSSGEKILGITEWMPLVGGNLFHLLVINTLRCRKPTRDANGFPTTKASSGRIFIYSIKQGSAGEVSLGFKYLIRCEKPVYALATHENRLIYCTGSELVTRKLIATDREMKMGGGFSLALRSQARCISVREPYVYITTVAHSVSIFKISEDSMIPQFSDREARDGSCHLVVPEHSLVLAADNSGSVAGLWQPSNPPVDNSTRTLFEAEFPVSITKMTRSPIKHLWHASATEDLYGIIGSCLDGSFHQMDIINEAQWKLLRFVQNLVERSTVLCPFARKVHESHLGRSIGNRRHLHVNGDVLLRLVDSESVDGCELLQGMLSESPSHDGRRPHYDLASVLDREVRFLELAIAVIGDMSGRSPVEAVVEYLRVILQPVL